MYKRNFSNCRLSMQQIIFIACSMLVIAIIGSSFAGDAGTDLTAKSAYSLNSERSEVYLNDQRQILLEAPWAKAYAVTSYNGHAHSVQQTSDGGYIVAGITSSYGAGYTDVLIMKLNSSGNILWRRTFGGIDYDEAYSVQQTSDGGYIVAGSTYSYGAGNGDVLILKFDANGNIPGCSMTAPNLSVTAPSLSATAPSIIVAAPAISVSAPSITASVPAITETTICP